MKGNYVFSGSLMLAFVFCASTAAWGQQPDLSMRMGVYLTGTKTDSIDLKNDPYAAVGKTLPVKTKQATASGDNIYEFNVGVLATRKGGTLSKSLTTSIEGTVDGSGYTDRKEFVFPANQQVVQVITKAVLHLGLNHLTIKIDPANTYAEPNENNNSVIVDLNLTAPSPQGGGKIPNLEKVPNTEPTNTTTTQKIPPVTIIALPDLTPFSLEQAQVGVVTVLVRNTCKGKSAATTARLDIYNNASESSGVVKSISANIPALAPGDAATIKFNTGAHGEIDGVIASRLIKVTLDPNNKIKEVSETNNWMTRQGHDVSDIFAPTCTDSFPK